MTGGGETKAPLRSSELKLQEEKRRLEQLKESLSRSNVLTSGMVSTLDNFERKLESLDDLITPVYEATNELGFLLTNVDGSLSLVDSILHYYDICSELYSIISSGPGGNITEYLSQLDRLQDAVKYFKTTKATSERERVLQLFDLGRQKLVEETDKLILRYANPLTPKESLDLYAMSQTSKHDIHEMQEVDLTTLRMIIEWFISHGFRQGLIDSYATKRGTMIRRSLQLLEEHLSKSSIRRGSSAVLSALPNALANTIPNADLSKRSGKRMSEVGRQLLRPTSSGLPIRGGNAAFSNLSSTLEESASHDLSEDRDTSNYKVLLDTFIVLLQRDRDLLNYVFPNDLQSLVFAKLIELPLVYMREEAQGLCESIERMPRKLDLAKFAIYGVFSILGWFFKSRPVFAKLYQESDITRRQQFTTLSATFEQSAVTYLRDILNEVNADGSPPSQGGNVHPLTSHVLGFMEGLISYKDIAKIVASIYMEQESHGSSSGLSGADKGLYNLGTYFSRLIRSLYINLTKKADTYTSRNDIAMRSIFLLNNINYLLKRLEKSPLFPYIEPCQPDFKGKCEIDFQSCLNDFTKCFSPAIISMHQMLEYDNNNRLSDSKLRDRDREQLKECFSSVNTAIETLQQQTKQYIVSDIELRNRLRNETKKILFENYRKFFEKFSQKDFTKNRDKYIRYQPHELKNIIENFFENHS